MTARKQKTAAAGVKACPDGDHAYEPIEVGDPSKPMKDEGSMTECEFAEFMHRCYKARLRGEAARGDGEPLSANPYGQPDERAMNKENDYAEEWEYGWRYQNCIESHRPTYECQFPDPCDCRSCRTEQPSESSKSRCTHGCTFTGTIAQCFYCGNAPAEPSKPIEFVEATDVHVDNCRDAACRGCEDEHWCCDRNCQFALAVSNEQLQERSQQLAEAHARLRGLESELTAELAEARKEIETLTAERDEARQTVVDGKLMAECEIERLQSELVAADDAMTDCLDCTCWELKLITANLEIECLRKALEQRVAREALNGGGK